MRLFFDTSAFLKRYIEEPGSSEVEELCKQAEDVAVSMLFPIDMVAFIFYRPIFIIMNIFSIQISIFALSFKTFSIFIYSP